MKRQALGGLWVRKGNKYPMTARKPTPYHVSQAVNEAAENLAAAIRNQEEALFTTESNPLETIRKQSRALSSMQKAIRILESVGAKTRP